jgi:hypothetical protein
MTKASYVASKRSPPFESLPLIEALAQSSPAGFPAATVELELVDDPGSARAPRPIRRIAGRRTLRA